MTVTDDLGYDTSRHDPDDALRDLQERQHLILEMQQTEGYRLWADFLAALAQPYQNRLLRGRHKDLMEYRYDAGLCEGIRLALTATDNLEGRIRMARSLLDQERLADQEGNDGPLV